MGYKWGGFVAAWGEGWPVVEVDDAYGEVFFAYDCVASVYLDVECFCGLCAEVAQVVEVEGDAFGCSVYAFVSELAVCLGGGVKPVEEVCSGYAVELDEVAREMFVYHGVGDSSHGVVVEDGEGLLAVFDVGDIFGHYGMGVSAFYPAVVKLVEHEAGDCLGGMYEDAFGVGDVVGDEYPGHFLSCAAVDSEGGVDDCPSAGFELLQAFDGGFASCHIKYVLFVNEVLGQVFFRVFIDCPSSPPKFVGGEAKDCGIVVDMAGGKLFSAADAGDCYVFHNLYY